MRVKPSALSIIFTFIAGFCYLLPAQAQDSVEAAYKHYHNGNPKAAIQILTSAVKGKDRNNAKAHYYLGNAWLKLGRRSYAKQYYQRALQLKPGQPLADYCTAALKSVGGGSGGGSRSRSGRRPSTSSKSGGKSGVGIVVQGNKIVRVQANGPGYKAGLKPGDLITSVDGTDTSGLDMNAIRKLVTGGPPGSSVEIEVDRKGNSKKVKLVRGAIKQLNSGGRKHNIVVNDAVKLSKLDQSLIIIKGNKKTERTEYVYNEVAAALDCLSKKTKEILRKNKCRILIAPTILEACPELRNVKPGGYLHGGSYHNCPGMFMPSRRILYIAETASMHNSPPQLNKWTNQTALHELGHAYDFCLGKISERGAFIRASRKDHQKLTNTLRERYWYYTQSDRGNSELFAEIFSLVHGKTGIDENAELMPSIFPNTTAFMKNLVKEGE